MATVIDRRAGSSCDTTLTLLENCSVPVGWVCLVIRGMYGEITQSGLK